MVWVTKGTNHIQHVYQHNIIPPHVQWQLAWWLDVVGEGKSHGKIRKEQAKTDNMARIKKKHRARKREKIVKKIKKEKKKKMIMGKEGRIEIRNEKKTNKQKK